MKLQIEYLSPDELVTYENNAKIHTAEQIEQIKHSIQEFGMNDPIAVWKDNVIIEGHGRLIACKELGLDKVPVIRLDELTDEQRRAYAIAHNKITENTGFDTELLGIELKDLMDEIDFTELGFGDFELTMLTEDLKPEPYDDEDIKGYEDNGEKFLLKQRVIITYTADKTGDVEALLGVEKIDKVVYDITELNI